MKMKKRISNCYVQTFIGFISLIFIVMMVPLFAQPVDSGTNSNTDMIDKAQQYYSAGKIEEAEHLALKIISEDNGLTEYEKFSAFRLLAFCSIAADNVESGKKHFISAIINNPNMAADPLTWSPKIRTVFDLAIAEVKRQKLLEREWIYAGEAQLGRRASFKSLYLPGAGQLMKKQERKGLVLGALTFISVSGYIYGQFYLPSVKEDYINANTVPEAAERWKDYRNARYTVSITGLVALAIYSYTFFDALWSAPADEAVKLPNEDI